MAKTTTNSKKGFTIIEVVLVLAIAGLIFLMVFIALPALQRSQRDTQRRNDLSRVITAIQNYQTNNRNQIPTAAKFQGSGATDFIPQYLKAGGDTFADPSGTDYSFTAKECGTKQADGTCQNQVQNSEFESGKITVITKATCQGEKAIPSSGATKVAVLMKLEGAGVACTNN